MLTIFWRIFPLTRKIFKTTLAREMKSILPFMIVMVASVAYGGENGAAKPVDTDYFSVQVPASWQVTLTSHGTNGWTYSFLDGTNQVFEASIWRGTSFLECFCAPWDKYKLIKRDHEKVRTIRLGDHIRTLKIAGETYSMDIHASHRGYDKQLIDGVLASIRMKRNEPTMKSTVPTGARGRTPVVP